MENEAELNALWEACDEMPEQARGFAETLIAVGELTEGRLTARQLFWVQELIRRYHLPKETVE